MVRGLWQPRWERPPAGFVVKFTVDPHEGVPMPIDDATSVDDAVATFLAWLADVDEHGFRRTRLRTNGQWTTLCFRPERVTSFEIYRGRLEWVPDPDDDDG